MKYTENDFINKCNELGLEYIGYYPEKKKGNMVKFICPKHKTKGVQEKDWSHFRTYKYGCSYCSGRNKTTEEIQNEISNKDVLLISKYTGNEKPIKCKCKKCGNIWETLPKVLITNKAGCPLCGKKKASINETKSHDEFVKDLKNANPKIEIVDKYTGSHKKTLFKCLICNNTFYSYPCNVLNGSSGCHYCSMSNGERKMLNILDKLNINYKEQYSFDDCKNIFKLKFDAYDVDNNIAFEYNGEQHYRPVDFSNKKSIDEINKQFEIINKRDNIKIEYCKENNIPLIIIPYWEFKNMESYIINKLKEVNNGIKITA